MCDSRLAALVCGVPVLDISGDDVARLDDATLRELIALLCEADLRAAGLPATGVTWGGDQRAADGGVDVKVDAASAAGSIGELPRRIVGIQVKATDMPRAEILKEMRPSGMIRQSILDLAASDGAYIIASSQGSCSDAALKARRKAMRDALEDVGDSGRLLIDFYDRNRIATWVRSHPGMIVWLRSRVGRLLQGWQSYAAWANPDEGIEAPYIISDAARIFDGRQPELEAMDVENGINRFRDAVRPERSTVRLVGLSGTGKTRMVQAMFDDRVGDQALNPRDVLYTNLNDEPNPTPVALATHLVTEARRATFVVDNCPPDLHTRLAQICAQPHSKISVLTVEYDVKDDLPERTAVFRVEPSSPEMIVTLVRTRHPDLAERNAERIADLSGGNSRVALALAEHVGATEDISSLRNKELFDRLFRQRNPHDPNLLQAAKAFSLVYSFHGVDVDGDAAELPLFARLAGMNVADAFRAAVELRRRNLVQARGPWRAVLPHALANHLAAAALEEQPLEALGRTFANASERLLRSFSRRLGFLHESAYAVALAQSWLSRGALLGEVTALNELGLAVLRNVAPLAPSQTLAAIVRAINPLGVDELREQSSFWRERLASLLRSLAYEAPLFDEAIVSIVRLAEANDEQNGSQPIAQLFEGMFHVVLSGTHASVAQRAQVIRTLLASEGPVRRKLGLRALRAMVTTTGISSGHGFEFGMRPRDYGYTPRTIGEGRAWFTEALSIIQTFAAPSEAVQSEIKSLLAQSMRSLWYIPYLRGPLLDLVVAVAGHAYWPRGWMALRLVRRYPDSNETEEEAARLQASIEALRPKNLPQKVRAIVLSVGGDYPTLEDGDEEGGDASPLAPYERRAKLAHDLGIALANDREVFRQLLPDLVQGSFGRQFECGMGIAEGSDDCAGDWAQIIAAYKDSPADQRQPALLAGFLKQTKAIDPAFVEEQLDMIVADPEMLKLGPYLHCALGLDDRAMTRLTALIETHPETVGQFETLQYGGATGTASAASLAVLLERIAALTGGFRVAISILYMRFSGNRSQKRPIEPELIASAQSLLSLWPPHNDDQRLDHQLAGVIAVCAKAQVPAAIGTMLCTKIVEAYAQSLFYSFYFPTVMATLHEFYPLQVLDTFYGSDPARRYMLSFRRDSESFENPAGKIPAWAIHEWCAAEPAIRYPLVAYIMPLFKMQESEALGWHPIAAELLDRAPNKKALIDAIVDAIPPSSWSGSRAEIIAGRTNVLRQWLHHPDPELVSHLTDRLVTLDKEIDAQREWELRRDRERDERFE